MATTNERFVSNLHMEFKNEKEGNLNDVDKEFVKDDLRELVNKVNDSHYEILDAFMTKKDMEDAFEKKYQNKISKLNAELNDYKNTNSVLSDRIKVAKEEERKKTKPLTLMHQKECGKFTNKNLELTYLKL